MKTFSYIITGDRIHFLIDGYDKKRTVEKTSPIYSKIIERLFSSENSNSGLPIEFTAEDLLEILDSEEEILEYENVVFGKDAVKYNGVALPPVLGKKIERFRNENLLFKPIQNFLLRLNKNPSYQSINQLYDFLEAEELPITEDGYFIAYKGISDDGFSVHGNPNTKVTQGTVDDRGRIYNLNFGVAIEVERNQVDDDRNKGCSNGLHVGSYNYASGWGHKTIKVKVDPADVVSVPTDCAFQKCRVSKYIPLDYVEDIIPYAGIDECGEHPLSRPKTDYEEHLDSLEEMVEDYLKEEYDAGDTVYLNLSCFDYEIGSFQELSEVLRRMDIPWTVTDSHLKIVNPFDSEDDHGPYY